MNDVLVAVLIPVRNGIDTIQKAIDSAISSLVAGQLSPHIIVVNDGSTDGTGILLDTIIGDPGYACVRVIHQNARGVAHARNSGWRATNSQYIALLDADDEMHPARLRKQLDFMESNQGTAAVGTRAIIGEAWDKARRTHDHPTEDIALKLSLTLCNPFVQSSMMIRMSCLREVGGYSEDSLDWPEDYNLWTRLSMRWRLANLSEYLTLYRETPGSLSRSDPRNLRGTINTASGNLQRVLGDVYESDMYREVAHAFYGATQPSPRISARLCATIWDQVALSVGGPRTNWSREFKKTFDRLKSKLLINSYVKVLPPKFVQHSKSLLHTLKRLRYRSLVQ